MCSYVDGRRLTEEICDRARVARDARFDGLFFTGVKTTGVYCRPVCPVRPAKRKNVVFFRSAAAAAEAGFRPCLRCRPETAPGTPAWSGTMAVVSRALRLIAEGVLDTSSVDELAECVGLGERHLRRLFREHVGATPAQVARTRRLHFAKQLIDETEFSMAEVSLASGFSSVRRFNDAFRAAYGRPPSQLRKRRTSDASTLAGAPIELNLAFRPPFDWAGFCDSYRREAIPGVEETSGSYLRCAVSLSDAVFLMEARAVQRRAFIEIRLSGIPLKLLSLAVSLARRVFDMDANPHEISKHLKGLGAGKKGWAQRIPGVFNPFAYLVHCVAASHDGVDAADRMALGLTKRMGSLVEPASTGLRGFPDPAAIERDSLDGLALSESGLAAVRGLAKQALKWPVALDRATTAAELADRLAVFYGPNPHLDPRYVAMRITSDPDAFAKPLSRGAESLAGQETWSPWSSYAQLALSARSGRRAIAP